MLKGKEKDINSLKTRLGKSDTRNDKFADNIKIVDDDKDAKINKLVMHDTELAKDLKTCVFGSVIVALGATATQWNPLISVVVIAIGILLQFILAKSSILNAIEAMFKRTS